MLVEINIYIYIDNNKILLLRKNIVNIYMIIPNENNNKKNNIQYC